MLVELLLAHLEGKKVCSADVAHVQLRVGDVLPHVPPELRATCALHVTLTPLLVRAADTQDRELIHLTSSAQKLGGVRWWLVCPSCSRRAGLLYWVGGQKVGQWRCRVCQKVGYTSNALHRTPAGDALLIEAAGQGRGSFKAVMRAMERQKRRRERSARLVSPSVSSRTTDGK